jgi:hypothetical protein
MLSPQPSVILEHPIWTPAPDAPTVELWDAWLFAELDAECALRRWWDAEPWERGDAFAAYSAALEREGQAAHALEARLGQARSTA